MRSLAFVALALALLAPLARAAPEEVHLGLPTKDPSTAMSVLWWDVAPEPDAHVTLANRSIPADLVPGPSAGFTYEAKLTGLTPGTRYDYKVGDRSFTLQTPPKSGNFTMVALADVGVQGASRAAVAKVKEIDPALVLLSGDISYAGGNPVDWKDWFDMVEPVAATRPWAMALGNHDAYTGPGGGGTTPSPLEIGFYEQRFRSPGPGLWYSFDWQGAHFVALDTFSTESVPAEEKTWLDQDLASHANATWRIAFLHEPAYSSNDAHGGSARVVEGLVPSFEKGHVDLVIQAHDHDYERSFPLLAGKPTQSDASTYGAGNGIVYVTSGGGGESLYPTFVDPKPAWSAARAAVFHVLKLDVSADTIHGTVVLTAGGTFADSFTVAKMPTHGSVPGGLAQKVGLPPVSWGLLCMALATLLSRRKHVS